MPMKCQHHSESWTKNPYLVIPTRMNETCSAWSFIDWKRFQTYDIFIAIVLLYYSGKKILRIQTTHLSKWISLWRMFWEIWTWTQPSHHRWWIWGYHRNVCFLWKYMHALYNVMKHNLKYVFLTVWQNCHKICHKSIQADVCRDCVCISDGWNMAAADGAKAPTADWPAASGEPVGGPREPSPAPPQHGQWPRPPLHQQLPGPWDPQSLQRGSVCSISVCLTLSFLFWGVLEFQ